MCGTAHHICFMRHCHRLNVRNLESEQLSIMSILEFLFKCVLHQIIYKIIFFFFDRIKTGLLDTLICETETSVRNSGIQVVAAIWKHEVINHQWPELLQFIEKLCNEGVIERELGLYTLSVLADSVGEELSPFLKPFVTVFHAVFQDPRTSSAFYAGMTIKNLIPYIGAEDSVILRI